MNVLIFELKLFTIVLEVILNLFQININSLPWTKSNWQREREENREDKKLEHKQKMKRCYFLRDTVILSVITIPGMVLIFTGKTGKVEILGVSLLSSVLGAIIDRRTFRSSRGHNNQSQSKTP